MIEKTYKSITQREQSVQKTLRIILVVFGLCFVAFLGFTYKIYTKSYHSNLVVDTQGNFLPYQIANRKRVMEYHIKLTCINASYYLNSFDRATLKSNQAKTLFYMEKNNAFRIFTTYKKQGFYDDVLANGYAHANTDVVIDSLQLDQEPFFVRFYSTTTIYDGGKKVGSLAIKSQGNISTIQPTSDNMIGWYFNDFKQEYLRKDTK